MVASKCEAMNSLSEAGKGVKAPNIVEGNLVKPK